MMEVTLKANAVNTLSADETRALAAHIQGLQQRLDAAQEQIVELTGALDRAHQRAHEAEANTDRIRNTIGWIVAELSGKQPRNSDSEPSPGASNNNAVDEVK